MAANAENPILLVESRRQDHQQRIIEGFGEPKEIVPVTKEFRRGLMDRISGARQTLQHTFADYPDIPGVVTMRLHPEAMAKSHRPMLLLERVGMRPVGTRRFGELLLPATTNSLNNLAEIAETSEAKLIRANLSTIAEIVAWTANDALGWQDLEADRIGVAKSTLDAWVRADRPLLIERFTSTETGSDQVLANALGQELQKHRVRVGQSATRAAAGASAFIRIPNIDLAILLAGCPAVRRLVPVDQFAPIEVRTQMFAPVDNAPPVVLAPPVPDLPVVAVVDSGVQPGDRMLARWVAKRETFVLPPDTDHLHGTFVAGLIAGARPLNSGDLRFPATPTRILDVATLATTKTSADELLANIETAIRKNPEVKVWNCSFGANSPGHPEAFGQFAQDMDALSDRYDVLFVVAAGNYEKPPLRNWPPTNDLMGEDRISQPAESLRALTVGSVAHLPALVKPGDPSPFSRRGPGAARSPKPDVTHRGGNCTAAGAFVGAGVRSLLPGGALGESVGTSFSTPLVSALAAHIWQTLERQGRVPNAEMVKALIIHAAALASPARKADERDYHGFGVPDSVLETLFCSADTFTMMFEADVSDGIYWEKTPFPVPACLHPDGERLRGEVVMTLVYSPPLDGRHGAEYVRANIDASFGSYDPDDVGKLHHHGLVPLDAPRREDLYEKAMVEHGFKWSPVKVYHGHFARGKAASNFRLKLELLRRAGEPAQREPLRATVILSFRGIETDQPVYADGIRAMRAANWVTQAVANRVQLRL